MTVPPAPARPAIYVADDQRSIADFVPFQHMTEQMMREHLVLAHGYAATKPEVGLPVNDMTASEMLAMHDEDHLEFRYGGKYACQHTHDKL